MADVLILEWLEEYDSLAESEIHTYALEQEHNYEVMVALYMLMDEHEKFTDELIGRVCQQLFSFYRSGAQNLRKFAMQYIPSLVLLHLIDTKGLPMVTTLLVSLYNLEIVDSKGQPQVISFRLPSIAQPSVYHDSSNLEAAFIAENSLRRWEECNTKLVNWGPLPQVETLNAQNRQRVLTALLFLYNKEIYGFTLQSLEHACKSITRLVSQGFRGFSLAPSSADSREKSTLLRRLSVSGPLLLELLHAVYHSLERRVPDGAHTLHAVHQRAVYESYPDVLLVSHAVKNLMHRSPAQNLPQQQLHTVSKTMITNASFRTKKLPDDIPIQAEESTSEATPLGSISEEQEAEKGRTRSGSSALKHLPKLPGLGKKPKVTKNSNSPTPQRNSMEIEQSIEMHLTGGGDQVSLVSGAFADGQEDGMTAAHPVTVV